MTPQSAEPSPQQLHLSDESEEGEEGDEGAEAEVATAEDQYVQPQLPISSPMRKKSHRYQLPAEQLDWLNKQTEEKQASSLENGNQSNWTVFRAT